MAKRADNAGRQGSATHRCLVRVIAALAVCGIVLGTTTLALVVSVTQAFRAELREHIVSLNDPVRLTSFEAATQPEQQVMFASLALVVVVAGLCIGWGLSLLCREQATG